MKLKNYLATLDGNEIISIGAKDGSSYVYIGEAGNVELIGQMFENYHKMMVKELGTLEKELRKLIMTPPKLGMDESESVNKIHEHAKTIARIYVSVEKHKEYINGYVNPMKRDVVVNESRDCEEGTRVIITGKEIGKFWFKSEFDKQNG